MPSNWEKDWKKAEKIQKEMIETHLIQSKPIVVRGHYQTYNKKKIWKEEYRRKKMKKLPKQKKII